ncbi:MAG: hypothetical protein WD577_01725 [Bacteroidales bacterium]
MMSRLSKNIGYWVLKKRFGKISRDKSVQNFETASSAVIVFDTMLSDSLQPIKEFTKFLKKQQIKTSVLGHVNGKEIPQEMMLWPGIDFLTRKNVNWYGCPKGEIADAYFGKQPDMLFVIAFEENLTIEYLARLSLAKFKVGRFTENENDLDLMINLENKDCRVGYFLEQIKHYIHMLNPSK